jgi:23S rRNA (uridine2552-2'-O)-methyltransferase
VARYQRRDAFHRRAKREGFRSRAAYKLQEIDRAQRILRPGARVVDLGCWPGGWLQVAAEAVGREGRVVGVDRTPLDGAPEQENVSFLEGDISDPTLPECVLAVLGGKADIVLSDAAPKLTGVRDTDRAREEALLEAIEALVPKLLRPGGDLLLKILESPEARAVALRLRRRFRSARAVRTRATRKGSSERYLLARGLV